MDVAGVKYMHLMTAYELGNGYKKPSHNSWTTVRAQPTNPR